MPEAYNLQVQTYMAITGRKYAQVAVLIGGQSYKERRVEADAKLQQEIWAKAGRFWKCVLDDELDEEFFTNRDHAYKELVDDEIIPDIEIQNKICELSDVRKDVYRLKKKEKELLDEIITGSDGHSVIIDQTGRTLATYKESKRNAFDGKRFKAEHGELYKQYIKTSTFRRFKCNV